MYLTIKINEKWYTVAYFLWSNFSPAKIATEKNFVDRRQLPEDLKTMQTRFLTNENWDMQILLMIDPLTLSVFLETRSQRCLANEKGDMQISAMNETQGPAKM